MVGPSISEEQNPSLIAAPSMAKIWEAVFQLKRISSFGPNGFSRTFLTSCWHLVGQDVSSTILHFFSSGRLLRSTDAYLLTLIPKKTSPASFAHFCPIRLLNFSYKVISKILAKRLSVILPPLYQSTKQLLLEVDLFIMLL